MDNNTGHVANSAIHNCVSYELIYEFSQQSYPKIIYQ